jgi:predicted  nucleic acid-binding Zn-ribbon protein
MSTLKKLIDSFFAKKDAQSSLNFAVMSQQSVVNNTTQALAAQTAALQDAQKAASDNEFEVADLENQIRNFVEPEEETSETIPAPAEETIPAPAPEEETEVIPETINAETTTL